MRGGFDVGNLTGQPLFSPVRPCLRIFHIEISDLILSVSRTFEVREV